MKSFIKNPSLIILAVFFSPFFVISSSTQEPPRRLSGPHPIVRTLDTNNDGSLSSEELREASKSLLKLDRNNDGKLTGEELRPRPPVSRPPERTSPISRENGSRFSSERDRRRSGGPRPTDLGESDLEIGQAGIAWYPKLEDGLAEAKRQNKPIMFMAVASQCSGIPGVF